MFASRPVLATIVAAFLAGVGAVAAAPAGAAPAAGASRATLLTVSGPAVRQATGSVVIRVRTRGTLSVKLNGRNANRAFSVVGAGRHRGRLGANDGLRHGRNRLVVTSVRDGRTVRRTITIHVARRAPVVGAGFDRRVYRGVATRLNGTSSRAATSAPLRYRWTVIGAPKGARARLTRAGTARPTLRASRPGTYQVRLTARTPGGDTANDVVTLTALPGDPPIGVRLDTLDDQGRVVIDGTPVPGTGAGSGSVNLVVLDRVDRTVRFSSNGYRTSNFGDLTAKVAEVAASAPQSLVIVSGPGGATAGDLPAADTLLKSLKAELSPPDRTALGTGQPFSVVAAANVLSGSAAPGSSFVNVGGRLGTDGQAGGTAGDLGGRLRINTATAQYGFEFDAYVPFATRSVAHPPGPWEGRMDLGATEVRDQLGMGDRGLQVVIVNPRSLQVISHKAYSWEPGDDEAEDYWMRQVASDIGRSTPGDLVMLQTVGQPSPSGPAWDLAAQQIARLGGTRTLFDSLNGANDYAIVGTLDQTGPAPEASTQFGDGASQLSGLLARQPDGRFTAVTADPTGVGRPPLVDIAFGASSGFPPFAAGGQQAANAYIAKALNLVGTDVRRNYWINYSANWANLRQDLARLVTPPADATFTAADLKAVRDQLDDELSRVATIKTYIANLQSPYTSGLPSYIDLADISKKIQDVVGAPDRDVQIETFRMLGQAVTVAGAATPKPYSALVGVIAGGLVAAGQAMGNDGSTVLGKVQLKSADLGRQLVLKMGAARSGLVDLGLLIVSDADKLKTVAAKVTSDESWIWPADDTQVREALRKGTKRWIYEQLMPVAWSTWDLNRVTNARDWYCTSSDNLKRFYPFRSEPDSGQYQPITGFNGASPIRPVVRALGTAGSHFGRGDDTARPPTGRVTDSLFRPLNNVVGSDDLGMNKERFYEGAFSHQTSQSPYSDAC